MTDALITLCVLVFIARVLANNHPFTFCLVKGTLCFDALAYVLVDCLRHFAAVHAHLLFYQILCEVVLEKFAGTSICAHAPACLRVYLQILAIRAPLGAQLRPGAVRFTKVVARSHVVTCVLTDKIIAVDTVKTFIALSSAIAADCKQPCAAFQTDCCRVVYAKTVQVFRGADHLITVRSALCLIHCHAITAMDTPMYVIFRDVKLFALFTHVRHVRCPI